MKEIPKFDASQLKNLFHMRIFLILLVASSFVLACEENASQEGSDKSAASTFDLASASFFGEAFTPTTLIASTDLPEKLASSGPLDQVQVEGAVLSVCKMKGCWMKMPLADGKEMRVRFKDYGFFVPKDCEGQVALLQGKAYYDTTSVDDLRHYAVDGGMSEEEAAETYLEPEIAIAFEATGVVLAPKEGSSIAE